MTTQEDKELLLIDLCARLPYGVRLKIGEHSDYTLYGIMPKREHQVIVRLIENEREYDIDVYIESIKPYLRPMSSITEEEKRELFKIGCEGNIEHPYGLYFRCQDWLNAHYFDFRNLIERGLAIDCTGLNVY